MSGAKIHHILSYLVGLASGIVVYAGCYCPVLGQYPFWRRTELWCNLKGYTPHHGLTWVIRPSFVTGQSYTPTLYPPNWITFCWFCYTAADWNVLLWIYMMWCYLGQLSLSGRIQCGVIRLPCVLSHFRLSTARKQYHNITACICMERRKNAWFECDWWYCNRPYTNVSQVMHNLNDTLSSDA